MSAGSLYSDPNDLAALGAVAISFQPRARTGFPVGACALEESMDLHSWSVSAERLDLASPWSLRRDPEDRVRYVRLRVDGPRLPGGMHFTVERLPPDPPEADGGKAAEA